MAGASSSLAVGQPPEGLAVLLTMLENENHLGPVFKAMFERGDGSAVNDEVVRNLRELSDAKRAEVQEVCHAHYHQFITTVDELMDLRADVLDLRRRLEQDNQALQTHTTSLLRKVRAMAIELVCVCVCVIVMRAAQVMTRTLTSAPSIVSSTRNETCCNARRSCAMLPRHELRCKVRPPSTSATCACGTTAHTAFNLQCRGSSRERGRVATVPRDSGPYCKEAAL